MAKLEVLLATTDQSNFDKLEEMNIQSDIIIANQSDFSEIQKTTKDGKNITMISTTERGVGRNRNLAMLFSSGDICILADDDMRFDDDYTTIVEDAFENNPRADIIIFNIDTIGDQSAKRRNNKKVKRIRIFNPLLNAEVKNKLSSPLQYLQPPPKRSEKDKFTFSIDSLL